MRLREIKEVILEKLSALGDSSDTFTVSVKEGVNTKWITIFADNCESAVGSWTTEDHTIEEVFESIDKFIERLIEGSLVINQGMVFSKGEWLLPDTAIVSDVQLDIKDSKNRNFKVLTTLDESDNIMLNVLLFGDDEKYIEMNQYELLPIPLELLAPEGMRKMSYNDKKELITKFINHISTKENMNIYGTMKEVAELNAEYMEDDYDKYDEKLELQAEKTMLTLNLELIKLLEDYMITNDIVYIINILESEDDVCDIIDDTLSLFNRNAWYDIHNLALVNDNHLIVSFEEDSCEYKHDEFVVVGNEAMNTLITEANKGSVKASTVLTAGKYIAGELLNNLK